MSPAEDQERQQRARTIVRRLGALGEELLELLPRPTCGARCESAGFDVDPCHMEPHDRGAHEALSVFDGATVAWEDVWAAPGAVGVAMIDDPPIEIEPAKPDDEVYCEQCPWSGLERDCYVDGLGDECPVCPNGGAITGGVRP